MTIVVTGAAGFIGYHVCEALLARGERVLGIDNVNAYYDPRLKEARLERLARHEGFALRRIDITDREAIGSAFAGDGEIDGIVHLAAQAGVRYSIENPYAYVESNVMGQVVLLEAAKALGRLRHFVYASSSSVYGLNDAVPFSESDRTDRPVSLYAATKKSCEAITHAYSHLFRLPTTGLRFFTVYGPWGRPDMAYYLFAKAILEGRPIEVFNNGDMRRDFTYVDDVVAGILAVLDRPPAEAAAGEPPYRIYNLGNNRTEPLGRFIDVLEDALGRKAERVMKPMQAGDVRETFADIASSRRDFGYDPKTSIDEGLRRFADWFKAFHGAA
ncbi:protein CapI [Aureimonas sp. Leaf454]|uniref:NAD-dependent epimerase/dehydratase family protein n=1 Tax=Aureimonas sp. Leaf454 TaxID=1736381 RepID=UPI0006F48E84|nr:NAD-dependent epimerase/dehydratase family protein [Aureimonas sp. Leaf454]KQT50989.1 protein CapI [Aureimonas sp. Leaf454]